MDNLLSFRMVIMDTVNRLQRDASAMITVAKYLPELSENARYAGLGSFDPQTAATLMLSMTAKNRRAVVELMKSFLPTPLFYHDGAAPESYMPFRGYGAPTVAEYEQMRASGYQPVFPFVYFTQYLGGAEEPERRHRSQVFWFTYLGLTRVAVQVVLAHDRAKLFPDRFEDAPEGIQRVDNECAAHEERTATIHWASSTDVPAWVEAFCAEPEDEWTDILESDYDNN